ncbi:hypothetical protein BDR07DRAFT_1376320 [Suillus spraguei]|nr:hypothetical protein BDR07DRAFT_1376320 [Suillus spraguei]
MGKGNSSRESTQETYASSETTRESSHRPRGKVRRFLSKVKDSVKSRTSRSKDSCNFSPVPPNECASSTPNIQVQAGVEVEADTRSALRNAQEATKHMHSLSGPVITVASAGQHAQEDLDTADNFQDTYLQPLRIFNTVIGEIANVWALFSIRTELIQFHSYIHTQRWHWACCLVQLKFAFLLYIRISGRSSIICADHSSSSGPRCINA